LEKQKGLMQMIFGKSHIRQIILEEMNKSNNNEKIKSLMNSFASELKNISQELKSDTSNPDTGDQQEVEEGATILAISIGAALPKILNLASTYAAKFGALNIAAGLGIWAEKIHHLYMGIIKSILNLIPSYRKAPPDVQKEIADTIFIVIIAMLTGASAQALVTAVSQLSLSIVIPVEALLIKIKSGEIKEYLDDYTTSSLKSYAS
jgi:hypothetical protein